MARTALTVNDLSKAGSLVESLTAAIADGHKFANDGNVWLEVENGSASPITVTVTATQTIFSLAVEDLVVTVAAGGRRKIGPFPPSVFNQSGADSGQVYVDYSGIISVTVGAFGWPE